LPQLRLLMIHRSLVLIFTLILSGCLFSPQQNSVSQSEKKFLKPESSFDRKLSKSRSYVDLDILGRITEDGRLILNAKINPMQDFNSAEIKWEWSEHLEMISGERESQRTLKSRVQQEIEIEFSTNNLKSGDVIFLFVVQMKDGEMHGSSQMYVHNSSTRETPQKNKALKKSSIKIME